MHELKELVESRSIFPHAPLCYTVFHKKPVIRRKKVTPSHMFLVTGVEIRNLNRFDFLKLEIGII